MPNIAVHIIEDLFIVSPQLVVQIDQPLLISRFRRNLALPGKFDKINRENTAMKGG
jgi:hypothetical protein